MKDLEFFNKLRAKYLNKKPKEDKKPSKSKKSSKKGNK